MKDYSKARFWAISGLGYGKGFDVDEAVKNHDATQKRNWGSTLSVPVKEIPLTVWEAPEGVDGFVNDGAINWTAEGTDRFEQADGKTQIRAKRLPDEYWLEWAKKEGLEYRTL